MGDLLTLVGAFGLSLGAGTRASIPVLALGVFHHTPYFELSPQWQWVASPPVLVVLCALLVVELWAVSHPDIGEYAEWAAYAPALIAGFIAFAAATGKVDRSLLHLAASGILGGTTSVGVRYAWHRAKRHAEPVFESADHARKYAAWTETGTATAVSVAAVTIPALAVVALAAGGTLMAALWWALRPVRSCAACAGAVDVRALRCPHCRASLESEG